MRSPEVDQWFETYDNPQKDALPYARDAILDSDDRSKQHASLMFHTGASIPGDFPHLEDELVAIVAAWCDMKDAE
jgi:hypothetical protein